MELNKKGTIRIVWIFTIIAVTLICIWLVAGLTPSERLQEGVLKDAPESLSKRIESHTSRYDLNNMKITKSENYKNICFIGGHFTGIEESYYNGPVWAYQCDKKGKLNGRIFAANKIATKHSAYSEDLNFYFEEDYGYLTIFMESSLG